MNSTVNLTQFAKPQKVHAILVRKQVKVNNQSISIAQTAGDPNSFRGNYVKNVQCTVLSKLKSNKQIRRIVVPCAATNLTLKKVKGQGHGMVPIERACMHCDIIKNNIIKQFQQSTFPDSQFRIKFPSTRVLMGFSCPRYEIDTWKTLRYSSIKCAIGMSVFFSGFMGNESECRTNKLCEPQNSSHAICLFHTPIYSPWNKKIKDTDFLYMTVFTIFPTKTYSNFHWEKL